MIFKLVLKEIMHRKSNFFLGLILLMVGVAVFVLFYTITKASQKETVRLTRDMGFNLRIIPGETDLDQFWVDGFSTMYMPENYVDKFMEFEDFAFAHVLATLHEKIIWRGLTVVLTGLSKELEPSGQEKSRMSFSISPGDVLVGSVVAEKLSIVQGDVISIKGNQLNVSRVLAEAGNMDDIRIFADLETVQNLVKKAGLINEITALQCLCLTEKEDPLTKIREQLKIVLPDCRVIMNKTIAQARERQRTLADKYFIYILPGILGTVFTWIGVLSMMNVRERKSEIGIYQAIGYGSVKISVFFLVRGLIMACLGAVLGFIMGTVLAFTWGPQIFTVTPGVTAVNYSLLLQAILYVPLVVMASTMVPISMAVTQDPARTINEE